MFGCVSLCFSLLGKYWNEGSSICHAYTVCLLSSHSECMLLFGCTIAFFHDAACNNPCTTWRATGTPGIYIEPEKKKQVIEGKFIQIRQAFIKGMIQLNQTPRLHNG